MGVTIRDQVAVTASSTNENILNSNTGAQRYIRPPFDAVGSLMANVGTADLRLEVIINGKSIMDDSNLRVQGANDILDPLVDGVVQKFFVPQGAQMVLRSVNPSAGNKNLRYQIDLEEATQRDPDTLITQRGPTAIAAGAKVQLLTGFRYERPRIDSLMSFFASASASGLLAQVFVDGKSMAPPMPVQGSNRVPSNPGDLVFGNIECPDDKLIELLVENPTGGSLNIFWRTELQELGFPA